MISSRFFGEVFYDEIYKPIKKLGKLGTIIDLGACTGEFSLWVYPQAEKIYAVECNRQVYRSLKENVSDFPRIKPVFLAITGKNERKYVHDSTVGASKVSSDRDEGLNGVRGKTLATFVKENKIDQIDCLKIDIENAEKEIFEAEDILSVLPKIKYIIGEHFHDESQEKFFKNNGFSFKKYEHGFIIKRK